jgi:hypothetical protein
MKSRWREELPQVRQRELRDIQDLRLHRRLILGGIIGLAGLVDLIFSLTSWQATRFGRLDYEHALRAMVPSATALMLSCQAILGCFFLSILDIKQTRRTMIGATVPSDSNDEPAIAVLK